MIYKALVNFEAEGLTYEEGTLYEIADEVVAGLIERTVEKVEEPKETASEEEKGDVPPVSKPEAKPATPWVGNHKV